MTHDEIRWLQHKASQRRFHSAILRAWQDRDPETKVAVWIAGGVALVVVLGLCWLF